MTSALNPGSSYRLAGDTKIGRCEFRKNEVVIFSSGGYSPYDDCYIYHFVSAGGEKCMCASQAELTDRELEAFVPT